MHLRKINKGFYSSLIKIGLFLMIGIVPIGSSGQSGSPQYSVVDPAKHQQEVISDLKMSHDLRQEPGPAWEWEFSLQGGFYANQWGANGGIREYGREGGWDYFSKGGNFSSGLNVDNTGFQLYQFWTGVGRQLEINDGWHIDVHTDIMYGTNAQFFQSLNKFDYMMGSEGQYGFALPQLYVGLGNEVFHVKAGKFLTPFGNDHDAFFFSDSYSPLPDTHMGAMADWSTPSGFDFLSGWTQGWNEAFDGDSDSSLVWFGVGKELIPEKIALSYTLCAGNMEGYSNAYAHSVLLEWFLSESTTYSLEYQYLNLDSALQTWGLINCLIHHINEKLDVGVRVEYQRQQVESQTTGLFEVTFGYTWTPFKNTLRRRSGCESRLVSGELAIRPEIRYDSWSGEQPLGFNNVTENHQISGGLSVDYSF